MKLFHTRWNKLEHIHEEAVITGKVTHVSEETQHFYYHRYVHCLFITLQSAHNRIVVKKVTPIRKGFQAPSINVGETIRVFGNWENRQFQVARIERIIEQITS
jgi:hypothetical protein